MEVGGVVVDRLKESRGVAITLGVWALVVAGVCASSMVGHVVPLPATEHVRVGPGIAALKASIGATGVVAFHFLDAKCRCSRRVIDGLVSRRPMTDVVEHVVLVDDDGTLRGRLTASGFVVTAVTSAELERRFAVRGAPVLMITSREDKVLYEGGYTDRKQAFVLEDKRIIRDAADGHAPPPLPVFGCAVAAKLERERNPMRIPWGDR
jgi:hypothetical protein